MKIAKLVTGEEVHRYKKSIVVSFEGKRRVLSTAPHNGGYREDLKAVFNQDCTVGAGIGCTLKAPTYAEHMAMMAEEIGLDPDYTAGISTAAQMENVSIKTETYQEITVTAVVTGGIEVNGGRVGDPGSWDELAAASSVHGKTGTINMMIFFNVDLAEGTLVRALVTATEAKTAAIQELLAPSRYSMGLATGSGTDSTILVANMESAIRLTDAGKHSKFGELIGKAVKAAVKEALYLQTRLGPEVQHDAVKRMERFGLSRDLLWSRYTGAKSRALWEEAMDTLLREKKMVTQTSLYAHLLDQYMWGLLEEDEVRNGIDSLLQQLRSCISSAGEQSDSILSNCERTDSEPSEAVKHSEDTKQESAQPADKAGALQTVTLPPLPAGCFAEESVLRELIEKYIEAVSEQMNAV